MTPQHLVLGFRSGELVVPWLYCSKGIRTPARRGAGERLRRLPGPGSRKP